MSGHRDPAALQRIARATELNIVASTGWYVQASHPPEIAGKGATVCSYLSLGEVRLDAAYGANPVSFRVFLRVRPGSGEHHH